MDEKNLQNAENNAQQLNAAVPEELKAAAAETKAEAFETKAEAAETKAEAAETKAEAAEEKPEKAEKNEKTNSKAEKAAEKAAKKAKKGKKLKNVNFAKRSTFMILSGAILLAVLILVNVVSAVIANKLPTTLDVTTDNSNSLTQENINFIKSITSDVTVTVCAPRDSYTGADMINYAYNTYYVQENNTPYNYFNQTVTMVESYNKYNSHIKVRYVDPQSPDFDALESGSNTQISYGDIIVSANRNGEKLSTVITFKDVYELYDASNGGAAYGYGYYTISASNIESKLSGAIYTVASSNKAKVALLTGHGSKEDAATLTAALGEYNYEITEISGKITADALKDVNLVLLVKPTSDLDGTELKLMDTFLNNDGKKGKSFLVFGSTASPATPNLNEFMEEWGIGVQDAMAYETDSKYRFDDSIMLVNNEDDLTKGVNDSKLYYYCAKNLALQQLFEEKDTRTSHILMKTNETAVLAPKGTSGGYTPPSSEKKQAIPVIMLTADVAYNNNYDEQTSYVGYFGSSDFIASSWSNYNDVGNLDFAINVVNISSGRNGSSMYFLPKTTGAYTVSLTDSQHNTVTAITLYIVPIAMLVAGISVWIYRKAKH